MHTADARMSPGAALGWSHALPGIADRLKGLRCVAAVAAHGSAVRAADMLCLSQPAVTRAVLEIEKFCAARLFERGARGMLATVLGARIAQRAQRLFDHLEAGATEAVALMPEGEGRDAMQGRFCASVSAASLKALVAIAASASEAHAAQALGQSQPSVHRALRDLESLARARLLWKSVRGTRLTDAGEAMLRRVKLAFAEMRAMESDIASWHGNVRGRVVIGALPLSVTLFLPQAIQAVMQVHPEVEVVVIDGTYESLLRQLGHADIDVIVGALRPAAAGVRQEALFDEPLAIIARPGHPCLARRSLALRHLLQWDWVMPPKGTPASLALLEAFAAQGLPGPGETLQTNNTTLARAMVGTTDRLALTSLRQARADARAGLVCVVPVALPQTTRCIGVALRESGDPSSDLAVVLAAMREASSDS